MGDHRPYWGNSHSPALQRLARWSVLYSSHCQSFQRPMNLVSRALVSTAFLAFASAALPSSDFSACPQFFAKAKPPIVTPQPKQRALCFDAFAILHSGESKTAVYVAQVLNRAAVDDADEKRRNKYYEDARLPSAERATLKDYKNSGWSRGHMAPAADMPTAQAMAQSFSLANMAPQAGRHNSGTWAKSVEAATRKYAARATGNVYVITGPIFTPSIAQSTGIGAGDVKVPTYLFKLVFDEDRNRAWAHWHLNDDATSGSKPISYGELIRRTGIEFLPGLRPSE
jgi:endonuclease G